MATVADSEPFQSRRAGRKPAQTQPYLAERKRFIRLAVAPSLIMLFVIAGLPAIYLLLSSFTPLVLVNPGSEWDFSEPLRNYGFLKDDARFINSVINQGKLSFFTVVFQVSIGLLIALLLNNTTRLVSVARNLFLIPMVLPPIVVAIIWKLLYTPDISPIYVVARTLGFALPSMTTEPALALWAIIIADTWEWFPFTFIMILAALQMIPGEYGEAARMDGAKNLQIFFHVTLPFILPTIIVAGLFRLIDSIKAFPLIFLLTGGGPGTVTEVTNYYAYILAFNFTEVGYSSSITIVLVTLTLVISWAVMRLTQNREALT